MMTGFGMMFGGLTIWLKNIGETVPLLQNIVMFFCGVYFPIAVLPEILQPVATYMPFYYSIEGLRRSLIPSTTTAEIMFYIIVLIFLSLISIGFGVFVLQRGLVKAKKEGTLAYYWKKDYILLYWMERGDCRSINFNFVIFVILTFYHFPDFSTIYLYTMKEKVCLDTI